MIAKGHKLTPSVYGFCEVKPNGGGDRSAISYSGPTFAAIRLIFQHKIHKKNSNASLIAL